MAYTQSSSATDPQSEDSIPFYPDHIRTEARVVAALIVAALVVGALGLAFPVGLGAPADPMETPAHVKPEWYFLALYQLLKFVPKTVGVLIPLLGLGLLTLWPFVDRRPDPSPRVSRIRFVVVAILVVLLIALTIWGELS